jgi:glycosyltransferase involved in cell wall biosynthesis
MISFIVPAHNEEACLRRTLQAIHDSARLVGQPYEIIVVDDASTDATAEIAQRHGARVVREKHRQIAATRNSGGRAATGDQFFFVDADTTINPRAVAAAATSERRWRLLGAIGILSLVLGARGTSIASVWLNEPLSRGSFAIWPNLLEGAGRGVTVLALGAWLAHRLPQPIGRVLRTFGSASLLLYALHLPFCYGRLASPVRRQLAMPSAAILVLGLLVACYVAVLVWARMKSRRRGAAVLRNSV